MKAKESNYWPQSTSLKLENFPQASKVKYLKKEVNWEGVEGSDQNRV